MTKKLSTTEEYFTELVKDALDDKAQVEDFMEWVKKEYGPDEWWGEMLGYDKEFLLENIKECYEAL